MRYSDKPINAYGQLVDGEHHGPAALSLLRSDLQAWNLAYLSFDFETNPGKPSPEFMYLLALTLRTDLLTGTVCAEGGALAQQSTIRPLLEFSPREFATLLLAHPRVRELPLYKGFGESWLTLLFERACVAREVTAAAEAAGSPDLDSEGAPRAGRTPEAFAAIRP